MSSPPKTCEDAACPGRIWTGRINAQVFASSHQVTSRSRLSCVLYCRQLLRRRREVLSGLTCAAELAAWGWRKCKTMRSRPKLRGARIRLDFLSQRKQEETAGPATVLCRSWATLFYGFTENERHHSVDTPILIPPTRRSRRRYRFSVAGCHEYCTPLARGSQISSGALPDPHTLA